MGYIGNYTYTCKLGKLAEMPLDKWMKEMEKGHARVSPYRLEDSERKAWEDCFFRLQACVKELPPAFWKLDAVFEYVYPSIKPGRKGAEKDNGTRADVLIISKKTVMVLEFKNREDVFIGHVRQARKYRNRTQDFHKESVGMNKKAILVLSKAENFRAQYSKVSVRSADLLAEELGCLFEQEPEPHGNIRNWLASEFAAKPEKKKSVRSET